MSKNDFQEIGHSGGKIEIDVKIEGENDMSYSVGWTHSGPRPAALFAVYAIPQGVAVCDIQMGGIGTPWNPPPIPGCYPVFISSDSTGMFGHQCPVCKGYWRSKASGRICPYCAQIFTENHQLLTESQKTYVKQYCDVFLEALSSEQSGKHIIDMDAVADAVGTDQPKPDFYYAEESQQNCFKCSECGTVNDVLGTYAYCCQCGTRNDLKEFKGRIQKIREKANEGGGYESCAKDIVAAFDSFAGQFAEQLRTRVPLTPSRNSQIEGALYHDLTKAHALFHDIFDIDILKGIAEKDRNFMHLMFHRRHVYEHKGGEADEKYIKDSGDQVRLKQALRETQESVHQLANLVVRMSTNLHAGFHEIFPPRQNR